MVSAMLYIGELRRGSVGHMGWRCTRIHTAWDHLASGGH